LHPDVSARAGQAGEPQRGAPFRADHAVPVNAERAGRARCYIRLLLATQHTPGASPCPTKPSVAVPRSRR
jgi:hypothetical protein